MNDDEVTMKTVEFHRLFADAMRWRAFANMAHLMIVDFNRRESGMSEYTKRNAVDACIIDGSAPQRPVE